MLKLAKEVLGAQIWQGSILLCTVLIQLAVARFIGPAALGVTTIIVSSSSLCILLIELNLQSALVRAISVSDAKERERLKSETLAARLALALGISPVIAVIVAAAAGHHQGTILIGTIAAVVAQELNPAWWLQGAGLTSRSFVISACVAIVSCVVALPVIFAFRLPASENLIFSLTSVVIYGAHWKRTGGFTTITRQLFEKIRSYGQFAARHRSFLLGGAAIYLYLYPTQLLLAYLRSPEEAGLYRIALMPGTAYYGVTVAAFYAYYPMIVRASAEGWNSYQRSVHSAALLAAVIGMIAWLVCVGSKALLLQIVGANFTTAVSLAPALMASKAIGGIGLVIRACLLTQKLERTVFLVYLLIGLGSLLTNLLVIPSYGFLGAAVVELTQEIFHLVVLLIILRKNTAVA